MVAGKTKHVLYTQRPGAQQVGLQRQAVAVTAGQLIDRLQAALDQPGRNGQRADTQDRALKVRDVDSGYMLPQYFGIVQAFVQVYSLWWSNLACHNESTVFQGLLQSAHF
jgi:hypothetical protein